MTDEECKQILDSVGGYDEARKILTMMGVLRIEKIGYHYQNACGDAS